MRLAAQALPASTRELRLEVREFLRGEVERGAFVPAVDTWLGGVSTELSQAHSTGSK